VRAPESFPLIPGTELRAVILNTDPPHVVYFSVHLEMQYIQYELML
jgi:hypothetical protein